MRARRKWVVGGIYRIRCTENGRVYIGSAMDILTRWYRHKNDLCKKIHRNPMLQRAWDKYGYKAFAFEVIEVIGDPRSLISAEQLHINRVGSCDPQIGYNIAFLAGSTLGVKQSAESSAKKSAANKGRKQSPEHVAKRFANPKPRTRNEDHIAALVARSKARIYTAEERAEMSAMRRGRKLPPQHVANAVFGRLMKRHGKPSPQQQCFHFE